MAIRGKTKSTPVAPVIDLGCIDWVDSLAALPIEAPARPKAAEYEAIAAGYRDEYKPASAEERYLVEVLAQSDWRSRQCLHIEAAILKSHAIGEKNASDPENSTEPVFLFPAKQLEALSRVSESADRRFHGAVKRLETIRERLLVLPLMTRPVPSELTPAKMPPLNLAGLFVAAKQED